MDLLVIYAIGYSVCWAAVTAKDVAARIDTGIAVKIAVCLLWPVALPNVAGIVIGLAIRK